MYTHMLSLTHKDFQHAEVRTFLKDLHYCYSAETSFYDTLDACVLLSMLFLLEGQKLIDRNVSNSPCKSKLDALNYTLTTGEFCFHYLNCRRFL